MHGKIVYTNMSASVSLSDLLPKSPFDSRVIRMISKATGEFTAGIANGPFELEFKPGFRYQSYKGLIDQGMFAGKG